MKQQIDCFISYAKEDLAVAQSLYLDLRDSNLDVWMDKPPKPYELDGLLPGVSWEDHLKEVMSKTKYFIALFSNSSVNKTGFVQSEFRHALRRLSKLPHGTIYVVPVRIDDCEVPAYSVDGISFQQYQWIDCFQRDFSSLLGFFNRQFEGSDRVRIPNQETYWPQDGQSFANAMRPYANIELNGSFDLSQVDRRSGKYCEVETVFDGDQAVFKDLRSVKLSGSNNAHVSVNPRYSSALYLRDCVNVRIRNISFGHFELPGECMGSAIKLEGCLQVEILGCELFGCGAYGLDLVGCQSIKLIDCVIHGCTSGGLRSENSRDVAVTTTRLVDNQCFFAVEATKSYIEFINCEFRENNSRFEDDGKMFDCLTSRVILRSCSVVRNYFPRLGDIMVDDFVDCRISENSWQRTAFGPADA